MGCIWSLGPGFETPELDLVSLSTSGYICFGYHCHSPCICPCNNHLPYIVYSLMNWGNNHLFFSVPAQCFPEWYKQTVQYYEFIQWPRLCQLPLESISARQKENSLQQSQSGQGKRAEELPEMNGNMNIIFWKLWPLLWLTRELCNIKYIYIYSVSILLFSWKHSEQKCNTYQWHRLAVMPGWQ